MKLYTIEQRNKLGIYIFYSVIFWLNLGHFAEQGIWQHTYIPLADSILALEGYVRVDSILDTYPIWGYPLLVSLSELICCYEFILFIQYLLVLISLYILLREFNPKKIAEKIIFYGCILCYVMVMSTKWPDAILASCLFFFAYFHNKQNFLIAAILLGVAYNFRTEALVFLLVYIIYIVVTEKRFTVTLSLMIVMPWLLLQYKNHQVFLPTTTNAGGVLYISLGQLPNNKWNRTHIDEDAYKFIIQKTDGKIDYPWGCEANILLKKQFIDDINKHPTEFIKKLIYNTYKLTIGGLYTAELSNYFVKKDEQEKISRFYKSNLTVFLNDIFSFKKEAIGKFISFSLRLLSIIFLLFVLLYTFLYILNSHIKLSNILLWIILLQMLITIFIQYQPRHISHVIILFLWLLINNEFYKKVRT
jgi:hypothetical protein